MINFCVSPNWKTVVVVLKTVKKNYSFLSPTEQQYTLCTTTENNWPYKYPKYRQKIVNITV